MQWRKVRSIEEIPAAYAGTPVSELIQYQNLQKPFEKQARARMLVGMCMDNRKQLRIPENFAYILRTGGANLRQAEFKISYAVAIGGVRCIALIAHDQCGMVHLHAKKAAFIDGLCRNAGWDRDRAEEHFSNFAPLFEIDNEQEFILQEARRIGEKYPGVLVVPLYFTLNDSLLSILEDEDRTIPGI